MFENKFLSTSLDVNLCSRALLIQVEKPKQADNKEYDGWSIVIVIY